MEFAEYFRFLAALVFVLGLIGACAWAAKRFNLLTAAHLSRPDKRLAIIETLPLDQKHKLALIRCDDREHLLVLGPNPATLTPLPEKAGAPASGSETGAETGEPVTPAPLALLSGGQA